MALAVGSGIAPVYWRRGVERERGTGRHSSTGFGNSVRANTRGFFYFFLFLACAFCKSPARLPRDPTRHRELEGKEGWRLQVIPSTLVPGVHGSHGYMEYYVNRPQTNQMLPTLNCGSFASRQSESEEGKGSSVGANSQQPRRRPDTRLNNLIVIFRDCTTEQVSYQAMMSDLCRLIAL